jgi:hypothetical protein
MVLISLLVRCVAAGLFQRRDDGHGGRETAGGEEVGRRLELLVVVGHHPFVDRVLRDAEVVVGAPSMPGKACRPAMAGRMLPPVAISMP